MEKTTKYLLYYFGLIILLIPIGFRRYFSNFLASGYVTHFHFILMSLWCIILVIQPILIIKKKHHLHKKIGKLSYFFVPLVVISMFWIMLDSYNQRIYVLSKTENLSSLFFPFTQIILFSIFYLMAILNKKNPGSHMRYIIISSVTLLGPTLGRINFDFIRLGNYNMDLIIMDLVIFAFLILDSIKRKSLKPYLIGLILFLSVHFLLNFEVDKSEIWKSLANLIVTK